MEIGPQDSGSLRVVLVDYSVTKLSMALVEGPPLSMSSIKLDPKSVAH